MHNEFEMIKEENLYEVEGGAIPFAVGLLLAGGTVCGSALVVGGVTYGVKKACEYVGSLF